MATEWASPQAVEDAVARWTDGQVQCRTYGHPWRGHTVTHRPGIYTVTQRCPRCMASRRQRINERGYPLTKWSIDYSESVGYLLSQVGRMGVDGKAVLRLAVLQFTTIIEEADVA